MTDMNPLIPCFAWSMRDGHDNSLRIYLLLTDRYYVIGTQRSGDDVGWYTRRLGSIEEAHAYAVKHTGELERISGDSLTHGPVVLEVGAIDIDHLDSLIDKDQPDRWLDDVFDAVMLEGSAV